MKNKIETLKKVSRKFSRGTFFMPFFGSEIEFYLSGKIPNNILDILSSAFLELSICDVTNEKGKNQYEVSIAHIGDAISAAEHIIKAREIITSTAKKNGLNADFSPKPFADDYGSALHVHTSLLDKSGNNPLEKSGDLESETMQNAIAGLLELMPASLKYIAQKEEDYRRLAAKMDTPSTISWGGNNRTVAIRLPTTTGEPENRRIEYRLAPANADPYAILTCIIAGINYGITNNLKPRSEKTYGDASLNQYNLKPLPHSLNEAKIIHHDYIDSVMY